MKIEVQGRIVEVDDSFAKLPPDQQQATVDEIASSLAPPEKSTIEQYTGVSEGSPLFGGIAGAIAGIPAGRVIEGATRAAMGKTPPPSAPMPPTPAPSIPPEIAARGPNVVENWARTQHAGEFFGGKDYAEAHQRALKVKDALAKTPGYSAVGESGLIAPRDAATQFEARQAAVAQRAAPLSQRIAARSPAIGTAQRALQGAGAALPAWLGRGLAGGSAGFQGVEAMNRLRGGDVLGGAISGLGALGSGAALIPHPLTRGIGTAVGVGAPLLNELIDQIKKKQMQTDVGGPGAMPMAAGGLAHYASGGHATPAWQRKEGQNPEGGLNAAGRASYHAETGGTLKPPVSAKEAKSSPKKAARRKSFCARMTGMPGPMKDESGKPTRKALALRKWEC